MKCGGVAVLVVGDLSRSPRMQYHAFSLTQMGIPVDLIGHQGDDHPSTLHTHWVDETVPNPLLRIHSLPTLPSLPRYFFIFFAPLKLLFQCVFLLWILLIKIDHPSHLLVQNPPSLPTLMVAQWVCWIRGTKLIIDWHNLGYSILALKLGESSIYVKIARWLEWYYGHQADGHLCVTQAMQRFLKDTFQVNGPAVVLYDRPQENFRKLTLKEKQIFLHDRLQDQFPTLRQFRINQDMLFITSTSWTADEDFDLLLDTLYQFHDQLLNLTSFQGHVYVIITGKGPLRGFYERAIGHMKFERVHVMTGWLRVEDYPCILGAADLGISLHTSSSNLDLPMKVVDMFGCGVPVCAKYFDCIHELVTPDFGKTFKTSDELVAQLLHFLQHPALLETFSSRIQQYFSKQRWHDEWKEHAFPFFKSKD